MLLRGGHVLTMDPTLGDMPQGDVLIDNGMIAQVAAHIDAADAEVVEAAGHIVMPGLVDTHRHTWQTQLRAICADWTLTDYLFAIRMTISPFYSADDVFIGNYLGALEAINAGVTSILDFSHCNNTPEHADKAIEALRKVGIRGVYGYGFYTSDPVNSVFKNHGERLQDFERFADQHFGQENDLLSLGASLTETGLVPLTETYAEIRAARARGAIMAAHTGISFDTKVTGGLMELAKRDLLGPDMVHVHCTRLNDEEWKALAATESKISSSPETELNMSMGVPPLLTATKYGLKPTLSCDVISLNSGSIFDQMRLGTAFARWYGGREVMESGSLPLKLSVTAREALEWATINGAEALGLGDRTGSLTPGKQADIIMVGGDSITQHPHNDATGTLTFQTAPSDVQWVLVGGKVLKRDGKLVGVDLPSLLEQLDTSGVEVLARTRAAGKDIPPRPETGLLSVNDFVEANFAQKDQPT